MWWWCIALASAGEPDVDGTATPSKYNLALQGAFGALLDEHPEITAVSYNGYAKGSPLMGTNATLSATIRCGSRTVEAQVSGVRGKVADGSWQATARAAVQRLLLDVDCGMPEPATVHTPAPAPKPGEDPVTGQASPEGWDSALRMAFERELDARPGLTRVDYSGYTRSNTLTGGKVNASATVVCEGRSYDLNVDNFSVRAMGGSYLTVADTVVDRLLMDTPCDNE